jgi:hypothetical protein
MSWCEWNLHCINYNLIIHYSKSIYDMYGENAELGVDHRDIRYSNILAARARQHYLACLRHSLVAYIRIALLISSNVRKRTANLGCSLYGRPRG